MSVQARRAERRRETRETNIRVELSLDGSGKADVSTGIGFFDHMLTALARHSSFDLLIQATGDLRVDTHHTVEDVGIVLGQALAEVLGDRRGIRRFGEATVPMDEALVLAAVDLSGRPCARVSLDLEVQRVGDFETETAGAFFVAVANAAGMNLHLVRLAGDNTHHVLEAAFKALARALDEATDLDPRVTGVPSTKGVL